ncbi:MAG: hypothetical protein JWN42_301, partial [Candidatus Angelobacter sp.]|nr:hypothetical protein [Candidatus Angelobacter sp.]
SAEPGLLLLHVDLIPAAAPPRFLVVHVRQDAKKPCFAIGAGRELVEIAPRRKQRLLDQVFGASFFLRQTEGVAKQAFRMWKRDGLELGSSITWHG